MLRVKYENIGEYSVPILRSATNGETRFTEFNVHGSVHRKNILIYMSNKMQRYTVYFIWKLFYMFRVLPPPIIRSTNNCIYSIWYLSHRY